MINYFIILNFHSPKCFF